MSEVIQYCGKELLRVEGDDIIIVDPATTRDDLARIVVEQVRHEAQMRRMHESERVLLYDFIRVKS